MPLPLPLADADAVVIQAARLFDGPGADARAVGTVASDTTLRLAARGADCIPQGPDRCAERWMIAGTHAWVGAEAIAVLDTHPLAPAEVRGHWLTETPWTGDGSRVPDTAWLGVVTEWEWSRESGRERVSAMGWLLTETSGRRARVEMGNLSGWGSAELLAGRRWVDLDGDGVAELIVVLDTVITEAGSGGRVVRVVDGELKLRHEVQVGDPRLTGLDQPEWGAVHLVGRVLVHDSLAARACTPPRAPPAVPDPDGLGAVFCPVQSRTGWPTPPPPAQPPRAHGLPILAWWLPESTRPTSRGAVHVLVDDHGTARWLLDPKVEPAWVGDAFATNPDGGDWVVLFP